MIINRRSFLQYASEGMLFLLGASSLTSCSGVRRDDLSRFDDRNELIRKLDKDEIEILYLASLAPSGHNAQPWMVRVVGPKHWIVGSDRSRWLPAVDPENRELLLSIGAFMENLIIAAGAHGYKADIQIIAKKRADTEIADIRVKKNKPEDEPGERIRKRRTVRSHFLEKEIKADDIKHLTRDLAENVAFFPKDSPQGKYLKEGTIEANRTQAFRDAAQWELAHWIRWSNRDARKYRNGLTPESMEIEGIAGWFVRTFYNRKSVVKKSFREQTVDRVAQQVQTCGGWFIITSHDSSIPTVVESGRKCERMLLRTREKMIAIHPMTQMLEEDPWKNRVAKELGLTNEVQWVLRSGYLKSYPEPVSLRMPVSWLIQK